MKRVILRVMMLVAMASAAVTMSVHTSSKEVKASEKGDAVVEYAKTLQGIDTDTVDRVLQTEQIVQDSREEFTRSLESVFHIPQVHREDMVRK